MSIPFGKNKLRLTPEEIRAKAEEDAAFGGARHSDRMDRFRLRETQKIERGRNKSARRIERIKAITERRKAEREAGRNPLTLGVFLIRASSYVILAAAAVLTLAGLWYDVIFYGSQSSDWKAVVGLVALAVALRFCASGIPLLLEWAKPERTNKSRKLRWPWQKKPEDDPREDTSETPLRDLLGHSKLARWTLRGIFVLSVVGCSFATLSFFSAGHEARQAKVETIEQTEAVAVTNTAEKITGLEGQIQKLRDDRDKAVETAQRSIDALAKDGTEANDGAAYTKQYTDQQTAAQEYARVEIAKINTRIADLRDGKQDAEAAKVEEISNNAPFLGVYRFLGNMGGSWKEEDWTIAGIWFFTFTFEFLFATLMAASYSFLTATNGFAFWARARDAKQEIGWRLKVDEFEAAARLESLKAQATRDRQETDFNIAQARDKAEQAQRKAAADREIAEVERIAKETRERLEAIAGGADPEEYDAQKDIEREKRKAEAEMVRAKHEQELAAIRAETDRIRNPKTPKQQQQENATMASVFANEQAGNPIPAVEVGAWSGRADRLN